ncbi:MAG: hypothetical protein MUF12_00650 [Sediminibacterium sp.]|jgi:hypothetical protein|nr:hypothetical protein [Sediminibacterium sp.]
MVTVQLNAYEFKMPESWAECSLEQISKLAALTHYKEDEIKATMDEYVVCTLLGCSNQFWNDISLQNEQWGALKNIAKFAFETYFYDRPFPFFDFNGIRYYVFSEGFSDSDAVDIAWANLQYISFAHPENRNVEAVYELIATLCRPERPDIESFKHSADWDGDIREIYNAQRTKERAKIFKDLPMGITIAILQYFEAQNRVFLETYAQMFGDDGSEPRYDNGMGWVTMLMNVADKGTFGNFNDVCHQNVHLIWAKCLDDTLDIKEQNKQAEEERFKHGL